MKKGKYAKRTPIKSIAVIVAVVLLIGCAIGGTIAWLTDKTGEVVNTFTVGNIDIKLEESNSNQDIDDDANTNSYKMVPGNVIDKDPKVTVEGGSEACYLFVKIVESANLDSFITYTVDSGWTAGDGENGVPVGFYFRQVPASEADQPFDVIGNNGADGNSTFVANKVLVKDTVTKEMMDAIEAGTATEPTLTFTAAAVQQANIADVAAAWAALPPSFKG